MGKIKEQHKLRRQEENIERMRKAALRSGNVDLDSLPEPLRQTNGKHIVKVYVEGYEDVAFWRGIFDHFHNPYIRFEVSVPTRQDLPKGKKVLLSMADKASEDLLLCMDSDFDYLLSEEDPTSELIVDSPYMFHTYAYATENYLCYAPSLHNVCVKATMNDTRIFDFESFMADYSRTVFPLFLWYVLSASRHTENILPLADFRNTVRLGYLEIQNNGANTIAWLDRHVKAKVESMQQEYPEMAAAIPTLTAHLRKKGVTPERTYLYMHGHTLMDCVVMIILTTVCEKLRQLSIARIVACSKEGIALKNEMANYNNSLRSVRDVLLDNENYTSSPLYMRLKADIQLYLDATIPNINK